MELENTSSDTIENIGSQSGENNDKETGHSSWCFTWMATDPHIEPGAATAALLKATRWPQGNPITISFIDGDPALQEKVKKVAVQWIGRDMAKLTFDFRKNTHKTDIRISFRFAGSWSVLGTTCKTITDLTQPTMNFGWLTNTSTDAEINRVVLHEFGHALGLTHEHMNPAGGINWDKKQVIKELSGPPNNWTMEAIENNMFKTYEKKETNFTKVDAKSIMMYPIPKNWTKDGFTVGLNTVLSDVDKNFIRQQYP